MTPLDRTDIPTPALWAGYVQAKVAGQPAARYYLTYQPQRLGPQAFDRTTPARRCRVPRSKRPSPPRSRTTVSTRRTAAASGSRRCSRADRHRHRRPRPRQDEAADKPVRRLVGCVAGRTVSLELGDEVALVLHGAAWSEFAGRNGLPVPAALNRTAATLLNRAFAAERAAEPLLQEFRTLSLARATMPQRLNVLRLLVKAEPANIIRIDDLARFESARCDEIFTPTARVRQKRDFVLADQLADEVQSPQWVNRPPLKVIDVVLRAHREFRRVGVRRGCTSYRGGSTTPSGPTDGDRRADRRGIDGQAAGRQSVRRAGRQRDGVRRHPDGYLVTNMHVVESYRNMERADLVREQLKREKSLTANPKLWVFFGKNDKYEADLAHGSENFDMAVLKIQRACPWHWRCATQRTPPCRTSTRCTPSASRASTVGR